MSPSAASAVHIAVLAKAPLAGLAKTRLAPALGLDGAAALAEKMLQHAVAQAVAAALGPVTVWATPDPGHPAFQGLRARYGLSLATQGAGDVGQRMAQVFDAAARQGRLPLLLMGTDLPGITAAVLRQAAALLADHEVVIVPALDGGYGCIGLRQAAPSLFSGVTWSTSSVLAQTRQRIAVLGWRVAELAAVADIDEPADLVHLPPGWWDAES